jgi:hypothetical protein
VFKVGNLSSLSFNFRSILNHRLQLSHPGLQLRHLLQQLRILSLGLIEGLLQHLGRAGLLCQSGLIKAFQTPAF